MRDGIRGVIIWDGIDGNVIRFRFRHDRLARNRISWPRLVPCFWRGLRRRRRLLRTVFGSLAHNQPPGTLPEEPVPMLIQGAVDAMLEVLEHPTQGLPARGRQSLIGHVQDVLGHGPPGEEASQPSSSEKWLQL